MKNIINNMKEYYNGEENPNKRTILFFGFYFVFFAVLIGAIFLGGDKKYLLQEYEMGDVPESIGKLCTNCVFDYKITIDGVYYNYYGKKNAGVESFKYNNLDYYYDQEEYFVNRDIWIKSENPFVFPELIKNDSITSILNQAFLVSSEKEEERITYHYLISSNTLNQLLYSENTDYDEEADSFDVVVDSFDNIEKISFQLNHFCSHRENCQNSFMVEMHFEMIGNVDQIDNPIE